jgi:hypothetical protein
MFIHSRVLRRYCGEVRGVAGTPVMMELGYDNGGISEGAT